MSKQIATNPAPQFYLDRGELYREDRNWDAAEADYSQAAKLGLSIDSVDFCRAQLQADLSHWDAAKTILDSVLSRSPDNGQAILSRAHLLVRVGQPKAALTDFKRGFNLVPEPPAGCFLECAQTLVAEGQTARAFDVLDAGIRKHGPMSALQVYAVDLEMSRTNTAGALARLLTIIDHADRKERWLIRRGEIQFASGKTTEARQSYEEALTAIRHLPSVLQRSPPTLALQSQINMALARIAESPPLGKLSN
jgi:tetratricopeptide (TPR) repeat protein